MRRLILTFALIAPILTILLWRSSALAAVGVLMISHALLLYPTLAANVQWLGPVVTSFAATSNEVWLTLDDGPTDDTHAILDVLDRHGVKATFFLKGALVERNAALVRDILERGHTAGNHSYSHPSGTFWCLMPGAVQREIERGSAALAAITGQRPTLFRAPVGMKNPAVHPVLQRNGMALIGWTVRAFDSVTADPNVVAARLLSGIRPGAIIVLHQGREWSSRVLDHVISELRARGYEFVIPDSSRLKTNR